MIPRPLLLLTVFLLALFLPPAASSGVGPFTGPVAHVGVDSQAGGLADRGIEIASVEPAREVAGASVEPAVAVAAASIEPAAAVADAPSEPAPPGAVAEAAPEPTHPVVEAPGAGSGRVTLEIVMPPDAPAPGAAGCDPSYPQLCVPLDAEDHDCHQLGVAGFVVLAPDRHGLDADGDGVGC